MSFSFKTAPSNTNENLTILGHNWLNHTYFEPIQTNAGGTPGGKVTPFSRIIDSRFEKTRVKDFTHGYVSGSEKTYCMTEDGLYEQEDYNAHRGGVEYYGFMNKKGYWYNFNFQVYNTSEIMYPGSLAGFSCNISVGNDTAHSTGRCQHNWGDQTQINHVYGLFYNTTNGKYRTEKMKSVGQNPYPLLNKPMTNTNNQIGSWGPLRTGRTWRAHFAQSSMNDHEMAKYRFCGFAMNVAMTNKAASARCHVFQVNRLSPLPVGYQNNKDGDRQVILQPSKFDPSSKELLVYSSK